MVKWSSSDMSIMLYNDDCSNIIRQLKNREKKIDLIVTSPPYYNAREYSNWDSFDAYMVDMEHIFTEAYSILNNHHYCVINVGDVTCKANKSQWSSRKFPIGAHFIVMMEKIGFQFIDDYIWDKGEPQSKRHLGNPPYPFYQYPLNCYEHILIFAKHELNKNKIKCPICHSDKVVSNSQSSIGVQSWECKNPDCKEKSPSGRGKRFSERSIMMNDYKTEANFIDKEFVNFFRRDIVKITPVIKINNKKENVLGHTAPFPSTIPEMAIRFFSGTNDVVADIFMGSGTTGLVCKRLNRRFIGIELNKDYFDIAKNNIKEILEEE